MQFLVAEVPADSSRHPDEMGHHELAHRPLAGESLVIAFDGYKYLLEIVKIVHVADGVTDGGAGGTLMVRRVRDPIKLG